jgi:hypothetical protein
VTNEVCNARLQLDNGATLIGPLGDATDLKKLSFGDSANMVSY